MLTHVQWQSQEQNNPVQRNPELKRLANDAASAMSLAFASVVQSCGCTEPPALSVSLTPFESKSGTCFAGDLPCPTLHALSHIMEMSELNCLEYMLQELSSALLTAPHRTDRASPMQVPLKYTSDGYWSSVPNASDYRLTSMTLNNLIM